MSHLPRFEWISSTGYSPLSPITQVYGVCFLTDGKILLQKEPGKGHWNLPGGTPEDGESPLQTLEREIFEETSVLISSPRMLGYFRVTELGGSVIYQLRYGSLVRQVGPLQIDPAHGAFNERTFVKPEEFFDYVPASFSGYRLMLDEALRWYRDMSSAV